MAKRATLILLSPAEKRTLQRWRGAHKIEQRVAERARIILLAAQGRSNLEIAAQLGTRPARVSKWRTRFARQRLAGLADELLAQALGDVSDQQVWRVLRRRGISLRRRRSWCVSTDPEFARKAADIVGLYLDPPENAVVLAVDEKPHIQALERAQAGCGCPTARP